jgi:hypothetical protein
MIGSENGVVGKIENMTKALMDVPKAVRFQWIRKLRSKKGILDVDDRGEYRECRGTVLL